MRHTTNIADIGRLNRLPSKRHIAPNGPTKQTPKDSRRILDKIESDMHLSDAMRVRLNGPKELLKQTRRTQLCESIAGHRDSTNDMATTKKNKATTT
jgi:hypothetical protein